MAQGCDTARHILGLGQAAIGISLASNFHDLLVAGGSVVQSVKLDPSMNWAAGEEVEDVALNVCPSPLGPRHRRLVVIHVRPTAMPLASA